MERTSAARNALLPRVLVAITAVGALVLWSYPTPKVAIGLTAPALAGLALIDFLRARVGPERDPS